MNSVSFFTSQAVAFKLLEYMNHTDTSCLVQTNSKIRKHYLSVPLKISNKTLMPVLWYSFSAIKLFMVRWIKEITKKQKAHFNITINSNMSLSLSFNPQRFSNRYETRVTVKFAELIDNHHKERKGLEKTELEIYKAWGTDKSIFSKYFGKYDQVFKILPYANFYPVNGPPVPDFSKTDCIVCEMVHKNYYELLTYLYLYILTFGNSMELTDNYQDVNCGVLIKSFYRQ